MICLVLAFWTLTQVVGSLTIKSLRKNKIIYEKAWIGARLIIERSSHGLRSSRVSQMVLYGKEEPLNESWQEWEKPYSENKISECQESQLEVDVWRGKMRPALWVGRGHWKTNLVILVLDEELLTKLFFNLILFQSASFGFISYFSTLHCLYRTCL